MSETVQTRDAANLICDLKAAVTALECDYKMNLLEEQVHRKEEKPRSPPMFMMIPIEQRRSSDESRIHEGRSRRKRKNTQNSDSDSHTDSIESLDCRKRKSRRDECGESNGPKMRGGVLHSRCGCIHRDGLQDSCPLNECQNQPACRTRPWATCPPAKYFRSRFPEIWPPPATDAITF